jgi:glycosyltransferase 2 family protein
MKKATRILFTTLRFITAIAVLVYLGVSGALDWSSLRGLTAAWAMTLAALFLLLAQIAGTAWRLCVLMKPRGLHLSFASSMRLTLMGLFFNACLPGATSGDVVKIYYASEGNRGRRTELVTIILLDRATGMFAMLIWPLVAAPFFPLLIGSSAILRGLLWSSAAVATVMFAGMLIGFSSRLRNSRVLDLSFRKLPLGGYIEKIFDTIHLYRHNKRTLLAAGMISLVIHTITVGVMLLIAKATHPDGFEWAMGLLVPLGLLANTLPLTPGGLGVGEAAFNKLFAMAGLTGGAETLIGWRLLTILWGLVGLIFYLQGRRHFVHAAFPQHETKQPVVSAHINDDSADQGPGDLEIQSLA